MGAKEEGGYGSVKEKRFESAFVKEKGEGQPMEKGSESCRK